MKNHSDFTKGVLDLKLGTIAEQRVIALSINGVAPEGKGSDARNKLCDMIYALPHGFFNEVPVPVSTHTLTPALRGQPKYRLGERSVERMALLKSELRKTVELAIQLTTQDFTVLEVIRTVERQRKLVADGASRTMKSKHLKQPDGFAWAVDLGAWNNGAVTWGFDDYFEIVQAMDMAATRLGYASNIRWGGIWDMVLSDYGGDLVSLYRKAIEDYKVRHKGPDFLDGPHFEWVA